MQTICTNASTIETVIGSRKRSVECANTAEAPYVGVHRDAKIDARLHSQNTPQSRVGLLFATRALTCVEQCSVRGMKTRGIASGARAIVRRVLDAFFPLVPLHYVKLTAKG